MSRPSLIGAFLAACLSSCSSSSSPDVLQISATVDPATTTTIQSGPVTITFPPRAVPVPTAIQLQGVLPFPATGQRVGYAYTILPGLLTFPPGAMPTFTYSYATLAIPAPGTEADLVLATMGPTGLSTPIAGNVVNTTTKEVSASLPGLATVVLLAPSAPPPVNGAGTLVFARDDANGDADLWKAAADGSAAVLVTAHTPGEILSGPRVAPGGARIAFTETVGGFPNSRAWVVNADGSNRMLVTSDASTDVSGDLDSTGTLLYVTHTAPGAATSDLAVYDLSGAPPFPLVLITSTPNTSESDPRLSPNEQRLLYRDGESFLWARSTAPGGAPFLVVNAAVASYAWSPVLNIYGQQVAVIERPLAEEGGLAEVSSVITYFNLPAALQGTPGGRRPTYSPNGAQFIFELFDTDPSVNAPTLRQIVKGGALGAVLLGGGSSVFLGSAPACAP